MTVNDAAIRCEGLTKSYGRTRALDGVDLEMPAGSIFGFLGPNGSGKTTTIKVLLGLAMPGAGRCWIAGIPVQRYRAESRSRVGYLAQDPSYPRWMTGREVLTFCGRLYPETARPVADRVAEVLALVGLDDSADRACGGYSAGMRQRLGIAQALMGDPRIVILDEPSSSLDPVGRRDVLEILRSLRLRGISVFYSTHILDDVERVADHVAIMKAGRVVRSGAMRELTADTKGRFRVTVEAPAEGLTAALREVREVVSVEADGTAPGRISLIVEVNDDERAKRAIPRAIVDADFVLIGCEPARSRLEDIFMESIADGQ